MHLKKPLVPDASKPVLENLLKLNILLSKVNNKKELLEIINGNLKLFFEFNYCSAMSIAADRGTFNVFLIDPGSLAYNHPHYQTITHSDLPLNDGLFDMVLDKGEPVIIDVETEYNKGKGNYPEYIPMHFESGIKELLAAPLENEKESFGMIVFYGDRKGIFKDIDKELISGIIGLVAIAASNVLANEEITTRNRERNILLSLSSKVARIRDKEELLSFINTKMKELFYFTHCSISKVCEDRETFTVFLTDPGSPSRKHRYFDQMIATRFPIDDGVFEHFLNAEVPVINSVEEVISREKHPLYSEIHYQSGLREAVSIPLYDENDIWGVLHFYSDRVKTFSKSQFPTFSGVANQVAVAVLNIIANEEIRKREEEKNGLLMVSEEISKIRDKNDLLKVITDKLSAFLHFSSASIIEFSENADSFQFYLNDSVSRTAFFRLTGGPKLPSSFPVNDGIFDHIVKTKKPMAVRFKDTLYLKTIPEYLFRLQESGHQEALIVPLFGERSLWGALLLTSKAVGKFTPDYQRLTSSVASQVSVAISNIYANADISTRKQEKENLLMVSHELGTIRHYNELLLLLNSKLRHLFYFSACMVSVLNDDGKAFKCYNLRKTTGEATPAEISSRLISRDEPFFVKLLEASSPTIVDSGDHIDRITELAEMPKGNVERISILLQSDKGSFGILSFFSDVRNCFQESNRTMITGVGSQVSITLSNILANEDVKQSEREKSMLLSFSYDLANARILGELKAVLGRYLKEVFQISEFIITVAKEDIRRQDFFLYNLSSRYEHSQLFQAIKGESFSMEGELTQLFSRADKPVIIDIASVISGLSGFKTLGQNLQDASAQKILGVPLRAGDKIIGMLWTLPELVGIRLMTGLGAQIAIALSNAMAIEKNRVQLAEIQKYKLQLEEENLYLQEEIVGSQGNDVIGNGDKMHKVYHLVSQVAPTSSTVLVLGETGTGKELIARAIHNGSPRKDKLMVKVNCAALPVHLIESELFGHEKGSFTGAIERRIGKFELANRSTLFLDEVGELPLDLQAKLLRVLQEKEIERLGGRETLKVDVRIIAATNRNLQKEVDAGRFRSDLFYRLNVVPITLPALRDRKEDIPAFVSHFIARFAKNSGKKITNISHKVLDDIMAYNWPGNVRELEHLIERSVLLTNGTTIREMHLPVREKSERSGQNIDDYRVRTIAENERDHILAVLQRCGGKVSGPGGAAELLGVPHSTLTSKMTKLGIKKAHVFRDKSGENS